MDWFKFEIFGPIFWNPWTTVTFISTGSSVIDGHQCGYMTIGGTWQTLITSAECQTILKSYICKIPPFRGITIRRPIKVTIINQNSC